MHTASQTISNEGTSDNVPEDVMTCLILIIIIKPSFGFGDYLLIQKQAVRIPPGDLRRRTCGIEPKES